MSSELLGQWTPIRLARVFSDQLLHKLNNFPFTISDKMQQPFLINSELDVIIEGAQKDFASISKDIAQLFSRKFDKIPDTDPEKISFNAKKLRLNEKFQETANNLKELVDAQLLSNETIQQVQVLNKMPLEDFHNISDILTVYESFNTRSALLNKSAWECTKHTAHRVNSWIEKGNEIVNERLSQLSRDSKSKGDFSPSLKQKENLNPSILVLFNDPEFLRKCGLNFGETHSSSSSSSSSYSKSSSSSSSSSSYSKSSSCSSSSSSYSKSSSSSEDNFDPLAHADVSSTGSHQLILDYYSTLTHIQQQARSDHLEDLSMAAGRLLSMDAYNFFEISNNEVPMGSRITFHLCKIQLRNLKLLPTDIWKAFQNQDGFSSTSREREDAFLCTRAELLLQGLKNAINHKEEDKIKEYLSLIATIRKEEDPSKQITALAEIDSTNLDASIDKVTMKLKQLWRI